MIKNCPNRGHIFQKKKKKEERNTWTVLLKKSAALLLKGKMRSTLGQR